MDTDGFREFLDFVEEITADGYHNLREKLPNTFQNVFIYVPNDKTPPKLSNNNDLLASNLQRTGSIQSYFTNRREELSQIVCIEDWNQLEYHLGPEFLRFCLTECIFAKKTKAGAFMVSNLSNLCNILLRTETKPQRLNQIFHNTPAFCKEGTEVEINDPSSSLDFKIDKPQTWDETKKNLNHLFHPKGLEISTDKRLFKMNENQKFPKSHVLHKEHTGVVMSLEVINTEIGSYKIIDYESCVEPLDQILEKLKKSHNRYSYDQALDRLVGKGKKNSREETPDNNDHKNPRKLELQLPVLKLYFTNICRGVLPRQLFVTNKNINIFIKIICDLLETAQYESFSLEAYITKMRISDLSWLNGVKNTDTQLSILGKLLKWIFDNYILEIFRTQLYIMVTNTSKKTYYKQRDWQNITIQFIRQMREDKIITTIDGFDLKVSCEGRWLLIPKKNGIRPIMSGARDKEPDENTNIALCYLQQLYITKYGESGKQTFLEKWRELVAEFRDSDKTKFYFVSGDIDNAYGSVTQRKLLQIVESLADSLTGSELKVKYYKIARNLKEVKLDNCAMKKCIDYPDLELPITSKSIFTNCVSEKVVKYHQGAIIAEIRKHVLNQNVLVSNQRFLLQQGLAQGAILSPVLCDMYYAHMEETNLSQFREKGFLYRYVDDILYATEDKESAERFLEHMNKGFAEYNCSFNADKTRTNLPGYENTTEVITYLGYNINLQTLEVMPEYSKSARYTTVLSKSGKDLMETFRKRLSNLSTLKLDGVIMDRYVNSEDIILENMKRVFIRQAERCLWLLRAFFNDLSNQQEEIFEIIKSTNRQIIRRVQRYHLANEYDFEKLAPRLAIIPWKAYRQVFGSMQTIGIHFRSSFIKCIRLAEHGAEREKKQLIP